MKSQQILNKNRYFYIDILKSLCALMIICIHTPFKNEIGYNIVAISRCAVPIFLIISGYFNANKHNSKDYKKQIKKILVLILISNILYFFYGLAKSILKNNLAAYLFQCFNIKSILEFLILNESPFASHLWYLSAFLYVLIIALFVDKFKLRKKVYRIIPILLITDLIFGKYSLLLFKFELPYILVRNFLFVGVPYYFIGCYIRENKEKIIYKFGYSKNIILIILFSLTTILERGVLVNIGCNATRDHYISSTLLAISLFICFLKKDLKKDITVYKNSLIKGLLQFLQNIGEKYSLLIYIIHPIIMSVISHIVHIKIIIPIIVFLISYLVSIIIKKFLNELNKKGLCK